jgi:hypothetical protein
MNADGSDRRQLTNHRARDETRTGHRTGRRLPSTASVWETPTIYVMNADGLRKGV